MTLIRKLLFMLDVSMLGECEGDINAGVGDGGGLIAMSAEYLGGTRGSGIVSISADVLGMSGVWDGRSWWSV